MSTTDEVRMHNESSGGGDDDDVASDPNWDYGDEDGGADDDDDDGGGGGRFEHVAVGDEISGGTTTNGAPVIRVADPSDPAHQHQHHHRHHRTDPPHHSDSMLNLPKKRSGLCGASSNLINSIVGAGIVGIPYAMNASGLIAGLAMLGLVGYLTDRSLRVIVNLASFHPLLSARSVRTYEDLASYPFGNLGRSFILLNMFIMAYGAMVAYLIIIKDTVPTLLLPNEVSGKHYTLNFIREVILICTSLLIVVPLSMQRDMASLSFTSLVSVTADVVLVGFVAGFAPIKETVAGAGGLGQILAGGWIKGTLFIGLGILSTAMACQHSAFIVSGSLNNHTKRRWATVTVGSITFASILCAVMGICGYLGFLEKTQGDIVNNFNATSSAANGARALLAVTMFFTYPMESFVARHVLVMLLHGGDMDAVRNEAGEDDGDGGRIVGRAGGGVLCWNRRQAWTMAIYLAALTPALFLNDLGPVLSITGSVGGSCVAYVGPGLCYLGVNGEYFMKMCKKMATDWSRKYDAGREDVGNGDGHVVELELPVAGDAGQRMASQDEDGALPPTSSSPGEGATFGDLPLEGERRDIAVSATDGRFGGDFPKPFWWYLGLFPLWYAIASMGASGMRDRLSAPAVYGNGVSANGNGRAQDPSEEEEENGRKDDYHPTRGGFCVAIFFVVFGVVGAVAGVVSNVYVQWHGLAY